MQPQSTSNAHGHNVINPFLSQEEQQRMLLDLLQQHQWTTQHGQEKISGASKGKKKGHGAEARRAARRAASAKFQVQVAELEDQLKGISAVHCSLVAENGMLRRRMQLLEQGVQMREQHIEGLIKGRKQQQQQDQQVVGVDQSLGSETTTASTQEESSSSRREKHGSLVLPTSIGPRMWSSFNQFPDPKSWCSTTCAAVRALTPGDYQRLWTEFVKEASMLALSTEAHQTSGDLQVQIQLLKVGVASKNIQPSLNMAFNFIKSLTS